MPIVNIILLPLLLASVYTKALKRHVLCDGRKAQDLKEYRYSHVGVLLVKIRTLNSIEPLRGGMVGGFLGSMTGVGRSGAFGASARTCFSQKSTAALWKSSSAGHGSAGQGDGLALVGSRARLCKVEIPCLIDELLPDRS